VETRFSGHGVYRTEYHVVWIPKYRRRVLKPGVRGYLSKLLPKILREMPGVEILEMSLQVDHLHVVLIIPPKYAVSEVVGRIKGRTASMLRKKFAWLGKVYWKENVVVDRRVFGRKRPTRTTLYDRTYWRSIPMIDVSVYLRLTR